MREDHSKEVVERRMGSKDSLSHVTQIVWGSSRKRLMTPSHFFKFLKQTKDNKTDQKALGNQSCEPRKTRAVSRVREEEVGTQKMNSLQLDQIWVLRSRVARLRSIDASSNDEEALRIRKEAEEDLECLRRAERSMTINVRVIRRSNSAGSTLHGTSKDPAFAFDQNSDHFQRTKSEEPRQWSDEERGGMQPWTSKSLAVKSLSFGGKHRSAEP